MNYKTKILGLSLAVCLSGCSAMGQNDFSCSGPTPGVGCIASSEVYEITNDPELQRKVTAALAAAAQSGEEFNHQEIVDRVKRQHKPGVEVVKTMADPVTQPLPVLQPAHAIRIWIAPWVDQKGDLHMPGLVFTEITPRRWSFGEAGLSSSKVLAPIQVDRGGQGTSRDQTQ